MTNNPENFGKGAIRQLNPDPRNYLIEAMKPIGAMVPFDWNKGFSVEEKAGNLRIENQNGSSSCVAQAWQGYQEVLEAIEGVNVNLSAKDIYSRIFQPEGGAYIMDGAKLLVNRGVVLEASNPSYQNGNPPTESFMRELIASSDAEATIYGSKSYATTNNNNSLEWIAQIIKDNNGAVSGFTGSNEGWQTADVRPPKDGETLWGHAVYLMGACMRNGRQAIKFKNSWGTGWGENGYGYFYVEYLPQLFDLWTLVDKPNQPNNTTMYKLIKRQNDEDVYYINEANQRVQIGDAETFNAYKGILWGDWSAIEIVDDATFQTYLKAGIIVKTKSL